MKRIVIIGAGKGGAAILRQLKDTPDVEIAGIADKDKNAPGVKLTRNSGIFFTQDYRELLKIKNIDVIIHVTGSSAVSKELRKKIGSKTEIVEGTSARFIWDILSKLKKEQNEFNRNLNVSKALYEIGIVVTSANCLEDALNIIVDKSTEFINAPAGSLALYDADTEELKIMASKGFSPKFLLVNRWKVRPNGMTSYILSARRPVAITDVKKEPLFNNPIMLDEGVRSLIAVPLIASSRIIGILYIDDIKPRQFTSSEISFLSHLGTQATFAIEKFQLLKELQDKNSALLETRDYLKNVLNDSADIIITTDREGRIVEFNKGAEKILGYKREEVIGTPASDLYYHREDRKRMLEEIEKSGSISNYETKLVAKDGKIVDISLTLSQLGNGAGQVVGTVGISKDITEAKKIRLELDKKNQELEELNERLEERIFERTRELELANRKLERSNKVKDQFIANMSHELRTPLNSIIGFSELLLTDTFGKLNDKQSRYVNNVLTSGKHLLQLINNILDIAKIEVGKMALDYSPFSIQWLVNEVMGIIQPLAVKKSVDLNIEIKPDLTEIHVDGTKFKQILYNLLSNAIKFTPEHGSVTLVAEKTENASGGGDTQAGAKKFQEGKTLSPSIHGIKVSVIDTGVGMKPSDMDIIFDEFEQVDGSYSRRHEGLGLGLALTKKLVELHGGIIWAESAFGKGSTFSFVLPSAPSSTTAQQPIPSAIARHLPPIEAAVGLDKESSPLVLVVEDDVPTSELITIYLTRAGYAVAHAFDGKEAIAKAKELKPFAVTLDVMLPNKDGWEVLQTLKGDKETKDIPVIINSIIDNKELGFVLGAADYLIKPVDGTRLIEMLNEFRFMFKKSKHPGNILLIERDEEMVKFLTSTLEDEGFSVLSVAEGEEGIELALVARPDLIIIDIMFQGTEGSMSSFDIIYKLKDTPATQGIPIFLMAEKDLEVDSKLKIMGYIDKIIQKGAVSKDYLVDQIKELEYLYPGRAGLVDDVTGLFNHRYFSIRLNQEINKAKRYKQLCSLIVIAIDDLQEYTARNGEVHGNTVLRKTAEFIKKVLRGYDIAVRYGREEVMILLSNTAKSHAQQLARRLKNIIETYPFYNVEAQSKGKLSISAGVASLIEDANSAEELISSVHQALSQAKTTGGDKVVAFTR